MNVKTLIIPLFLVLYFVVCSDAGTNNIVQDG